MNAGISMVLWMALQVALFSIVGLLSFVLFRRRGPNGAVACAAVVLALTLPLALMVASPWPRWTWKSEISNFKSQITSTDEIRNIAAGDTNLQGPVQIPATETTGATLSLWWQRATAWMEPTNIQTSATAATRWQTWLFAAIAA